METLVGTLVVFLLMVGAMGFGVMATGRALSGSCGGTGKACTCTRAERRSCELAKAARKPR